MGTNEQWFKGWTGWSMEGDSLYPLKDGYLDPHHLRRFLVLIGFKPFQRNLRASINL